ncbi:hypothetical protein [Escherichia coli]|uniref:hypothetical protein n=1 Tax=Escherichia coli TaxID=562 RepID=UPI002E782925|nr:hypothetical protein [Escherichia coli]
MPPTPAGSGKSARPVPDRTRDTDHRQRSCRAASAGAVKRGARRHLLSPNKNPKQTPPTHHQKIDTHKTPKNKKPNTQKPKKNQKQNENP